MSSSNFLPSIQYFRLSTIYSDSTILHLYEGKENILKVELSLGGLNNRTLPFIHEELDYVALHITIFHQFGGMDTTTVRRYVVQYDPAREIFEDVQDLVIEIPIDDDFSSIDFVTNFYFLQMSFTEKHLGEMGLDESVYLGKFFETKIPFVLVDKEK